MSLNVHIVSEPEPENLHLLRSLLEDEIDLTTGSEVPTPVEYHILVAGRPEREQVTASPRIHTLIIPWAGIPGKTRALMREFPRIAVHNLHHNAAPTAELAVALLLAAAKFLLPFDRALRYDDWTPRYEPNPALLLEGKTALILGFGEIGQRVGSVCQVLGMKVIGVRRRPQQPLPPGLDARVYSPEDLLRLLPETDVLILTLPLTPQTEGMVGAQELALMPPGGILVNVGRGPLVDQAGLFHALRDKSLRAAGLDVWYNYPKEPQDRSHTAPADYPFHELENVVMSPHRGGGSTETERLRMQHLANSLNAAARGLPIPNPVDLRLGY